MNKIFLILIFVTFSNVTFSQNDYYWYKNEKIYLKRNPNKKMILVENISNSTELKNILNISGLKVIKFHSINKGSNIETYNETRENKNINFAIVQSDENNLERLSENSNILYQASFYKWKNVEFGISHLLYVKLYKVADIEILRKVADLNNVNILGENKFNPLWYTLACTKSSNADALTMANRFYETGLFCHSTPDKLIEDWFSCVDDTEWAEQWGLLNSGQHGGTNGIDINACQAWDISSGDPNIVIAVLDEGVELDHPDLSNMFPLSFDTQTGTSPSAVYGSHGTAVAGIAAANGNNNTGVTGVAGDCHLMSISVNFFLQIGIEARLANGLDFATQNGADVINNSWGGGVPTPVIDDAITNALTFGRDGLGSVVTFAAGNQNDDVNYPANSNDNIIAVGAMNMCGERKRSSANWWEVNLGVTPDPLGVSCDGELVWGSNFGPELDVVAPGVLIPTTDRQGADGYNPNDRIHPDCGGTLVTNDFADDDYTRWFNGTSSACPHVTGVAALILSVNPCLSNEDVIEIIETTAQKVGGYTFAITPGRPNGTWNNEMGYGLVNAEAAVNLAATYNTTTLRDRIFNDDINLTGCDNIQMQNCQITNAANITIDVQGSISIIGTFNAELGTILSIQP